MTQCTHKFSLGIALVNLFGFIDGSGTIRFDARDGQTLYPVSAKVVSCWKCEFCGHSEHTNTSSSGDTWK